MSRVIYARSCCESCSSRDSRPRLSKRPSLIEPQPVRARHPQARPVEQASAGLRQSHQKISASAPEVISSPIKKAPNLPGATNLATDTQKLIFNI